MPGEKQANAPRRRPVPMVGRLDRIYAAILRQTAWPLMNHATGRTIHQKICFLDRSQWWSRDELLAYQLAKLQRLMRYVYENVPFYGREMRARDLHPDDFKSVAVLRAMPVVTKAALKANPDDYLARGATYERLVKGRTSGSTGEPTTFYRSREQDSWHWALKYRMWGMAGYELGWPHVCIYNSPRRGWSKRIQDRLLRNRDMYVFAQSNQRQFFEELLAALAPTNMRFLAGCTTPIRLFADYVAARSDPSDCGLDAILTTGNVLASDERQAIESSLGAPVWDHYGLGGEGAHVAAECEQKRGYHVNIENVLIEPVEPETVDRDAPTGVLATILDNWDWPLIRYETGDAARFWSHACPCGRGLPLIGQIEGRTSEILTLPNGTRLATHYFAVIGKRPNVQRYQVEQTAPDHLLVRVVWQGEAGRDRTRQEVTAALADVSEGSVRVSFEDVDDIPLMPSGKRRYIIPWSAPANGSAADPRVDEHD